MTANRWPHGDACSGSSNIVADGRRRLPQRQVPGRRAGRRRAASVASAATRASLRGRSSRSIRHTIMLSAAAMASERRVTPTRVVSMVLT